MVKRMWKANRIFTFLFWISFTVTFCIVYYGMFLGSQIQQTDATADQMKYEYRGYYMVAWTEDTGSRMDIELPELNQGILSYSLLVHNGEDIVGVKSAYVVMEMYEDLLEPLKEGTYFKAEETYDYPQCIVGDAWLASAKKDGGTTIVNINGYECQAVGILNPNTFEGSDERVYLYGPSMSREFLEELIAMNETMSVDYRIAENADPEQIEIYKTWLNSDIFESAEEMNMEEIDGGVNLEFAEVMPLYRKFFVFMMLFCFVNCAFLTYVWGTKKVQENMIKRVFGYDWDRIWWDGFKEIVVYEGISIITSSVICIVIEACRGNVLSFFTTWKYGVRIMAVVLLLFTLLLSMIYVSYVNKRKPADTLKAAE